jgi:predicted regulator of Ras-like GTPase activity (Roadblock/LC7/MglB family)
MALSRAERSSQIDKHLAALTSLRGVTGAALVDADGFVTHVRRDFEIDTDALGAAVQIMYGSAQRAAANVGQGNPNVLLSENSDGLVMLAPCGGGILALVADREVMLGAVRFEVKETVSEINRLF